MNLLFRTFLLRLQQHFMDFDPIAKQDAIEPILQGYEPFFLIGAPRSGSTAFIQLLYQNLQLAYISNLIALIPNKMISLTKRYPFVAKGYSGNIRKSSYGFIPGLLSPNEAGKIMHFWFDTELTDRQILAIRQTVNEISRATGCPLFFKNQCNTTRLKAIQTALPNSKFIFLKRNPIYTAQSLLLTRRNLFGDERVWWSVQPPGYQEVLKYNPYYQVIWQVLRLEQIAHATCAARPEQCITIEYEELCDNPSKSISSIQSKFRLNKNNVSRAIPLTLELANRIKIPAPEWDQLEQAYEEIKEKFQ